MPYTPGVVRAMNCSRMPDPMIRARPGSIGLMLLMVAAGCSTEEPGMGGWYSPQPLAWVPCEEAVGPYAFEEECTTLRVPVDWGDPESGELELGLARLPAVVPDERKGVVIVLSGGPGGSGLLDLAEVADGLPEVRDRFDLVAHEPRTFQALQTLPASCYEPAGPVLDFPESEAAYDRIIKPLVRGVERCRAEDERGLLDHLDGLSQAMDVEAIRRALGEDVVNFTAQSYGGVVVATYARHFPERVRAAFVDGSPSHPDAPYSRDSGLVESVFRSFVEWCESSEECVLSDENVSEVWRDLTDQANREPVPAVSEHYGEVKLSGLHLHFLTPGWQDPGEDYENWRQLAEDIERAWRGDASPFADFALRNTEGWGIPVMIALQCPDGRAPAPGFRDFLHFLERQALIAPHTYGRALLSMACGAWPLPVANPPAPLPGDDLPPFLGAGTADNDYSGTEQLLEHIPGSVAIEVDGAGHVVYLPGPAGPANECVLEHLSRYLMNLELPPRPSRCASQRGPRQ
jgi:pimeloyl-ACP methyl ester carboxylesterase